MRGESGEGAQRGQWPRCRADASQAPRKGGVPKHRDQHTSTAPREDGSLGHQPPPSRPAGFQNKVITPCSERKKNSQGLRPKRPLAQAKPTAACFRRGKSLPSQGRVTFQSARVPKTDCFPGQQLSDPANSTKERPRSVCDTLLTMSPRFILHIFRPRHLEQSWSRSDSVQTPPAGCGRWTRTDILLSCIPTVSHATDPASGHHWSDITYLGKLAPTVSSQTFL